jgi:hypothetical protein
MHATTDNMLTGDKVKVGLTNTVRVVTGHDMACYLWTLAGLYVGSRNQLYRVAQNPLDTAHCC